MHADQALTHPVPDLPPPGAAPRPEPHAKAADLGRLMIDLVAEKLGSGEAASAWVDAILVPTRAGTPERRASDKANGQLVRNVLAVAGEPA